MRIPSSVKIMGKWIPIKYKDSLPNDDEGQYHPHQRMIEINKTSKIPKHVLVHEICHAIFHSYNLSTLLDSETNEEMICLAMEDLAEFMSFDPNSKNIRWKEVGDAEDSP